MIEITKLKKQRDIKGGVIINVDMADAYLLIKSLSAQLASGSPNVGRKEFYTDDGQYFSIGVHKDLVKRRKALEELKKEEKRK